MQPGPWTLARPAFICGLAFSLSLAIPAGARAAAPAGSSDDDADDAAPAARNAKPSGAAQDDSDAVPAKAPAAKAKPAPAGTSDDDEDAPPPKAKSGKTKPVVAPAAAPTDGDDARAKPAPSEKPANVKPVGAKDSADGEATPKPAEQIRPTTDAKPAETAAKPAGAPPPATAATPTPAAPAPAAPPPAPIVATARKAGDLAPTFFLKPLNPVADGPQVFDLHSYVGAHPAHPRKAVLISFFSMASKPSVKELPTLVQLAKKYGGQGLQIVSVSIDKDTKDLPKLIKSNGVAHPFVSDPLNLLATRYLGPSLKAPGAVFVWADGTIASIRQGYDGDPAWIEADVRLLLGLPSDAPKKHGKKPKATG